jgi:hypothetical protein
MGLDMYLSAKKFVSNAEWRSDAEKQLFQTIIDKAEANNFVNDYLPSINLEVSIAQWRKANQIHNWFVLNCSNNGEDDCKPLYVERSQLQELLDTCKEIKTAENPAEKAEELLPPQSGFFFGSVEVDEWYFMQIDYTIAKLEKILAEVPEDWDFEYHASW